MWRDNKQFDKAITDFNEALRLDPKEKYAPILGHFAARNAGDEAASKKILKHAVDQGNKDWPIPIVKFLRGDIDEKALLALATDNDKLTEAHCYLGMDHGLRKRTEQAIAHFRWVRDNGNPSFIEFGISVAELERLAKDK